MSPSRGLGLQCEDRRRRSLFPEFGRGWPCETANTLINSPGYKVRISRAKIVTRYNGGSGPIQSREKCWGGTLNIISFSSFRLSLNAAVFLIPVKWSAIPAMWGTVPVNWSTGTVSQLAGCGGYRGMPLEPLPLKLASLGSNVLPVTVRHLGLTHLLDQSTEVPQAGDRRRSLTVEHSYVLARAAQPNSSLQLLQ